MRYHEFKLGEETNQQTVGTTTLGGFPATILDVEESGMDEALQLNPDYRTLPRSELQQLATRVKKKKKTKRDKFGPIVHASNIQAITKSENPEDIWDLDQLAALIMERPTAVIGENAKMKKTRTLLGKNSKMSKSAVGSGDMVYKITMPALKGLVVDEETGEFAIVSTCPSAKTCVQNCYAMKGNFLRFPGTSLKASRSLNYLLNDPQGYMNLISKEITRGTKSARRQGLRFVVRWHDAGDFFSKDYLNLAYDVAKQHPDVIFYFYTKVADFVINNNQENVVATFSHGARTSDEEKIEQHLAQGNRVKRAHIVPYPMIKQYVKLVDYTPPPKPPKPGKKQKPPEKDIRTEWKDANSLASAKRVIGMNYGINPKTILSYDEMMRTPESNGFKWNVIVTPSEGDNAAYRRDVENIFLIEH